MLSRVLFLNLVGSVSVLSTILGSQIILERRLKEAKLEKTDKVLGVCCFQLHSNHFHFTLFSRKLFSYVYRQSHLSFADPLL